MASQECGISKEIRDAETICELSELIRRHGSEKNGSSSLNVIHITALLVKLSKLSGTDGQSPSPSRQGRRGIIMEDGGDPAGQTGHREHDRLAGSTTSSRARDQTAGSGPSSATHRPPSVRALVTQLLRAIQPLILEFDSQVCLWVW
jgi:hypothetical protein